MSLFPTQGTELNWVTSNGRRIPISSLSKPHLANIITMLYEAASKQIGSKANSIYDTGYYTNKTIQKFLEENCRSWQTLRFFGSCRNWLDGTGCPTEYLKNYNERLEKEISILPKINDVPYLINRFKAIEITLREYIQLNQVLLTRIKE